MERFPTNNKGHKLKDREIKHLEDLKILRKQPLENYFEGTNKRKINKRKTLVHKTKCQHELIIPQTQETVSASPLGQSQERENKAFVRSKQAQLNIYKNLKKIEYNERRSYMRQKAAENNYIEQQENLAETWMGVLRRRQQLYQENSDLNYKPKPFHKEPPFRRKIGISIISRRFWKEDEDPTLKRDEKLPPKVEEKSQQKLSELQNQIYEPSNYVQNKSLIDELNGEMLKQLVFVDNEESD